jgi:hypothetical protein
MRRSVAVGLALALGLTLVAVPVAAHTNTVVVDAQVSADGTVTVEAATSLVDAFVVVHDREDGELGAVLGYVPITQNDGYRQGFPVEIDDDTWADWGDNRTMSVALRRDEGDEGFDPAEDPVQGGFGGPVVRNVTVGKGSAPARVINELFEIPYPLDTDAVSLREVAVGEPGLVVVRAHNASGPVAGTRPLDPGVHENVTVSLDDAVFDREGREVELWVGLRVGGGTLADSRPLTVGDDRVATSFGVERVGQLNATATPPPAATTASGTPTPTATPLGTTRPLVVTPSVTETSTASPTAAPTPTATRSSASGGGTTAESGPGMGVVAGAFAAVLGALALARRRR